ncbi:hypothetical protein KSP40_PGU018824 [Platanthera guangdongensis]|uniref:DUF1677 family protein n=1 Tax=Platanthera guangdongensis TaxID=2320717 RepID=A0ABR2MFD6_9ASPA
MEVDSANCECCGLREDCTQAYIAQVKASFDGKWLCGLCAEAVRDEMKNCKKEEEEKTEDAMKAHMSFCSTFRSNPAVRVADGMRQMLRRRSSDLPTSKTTASFSPSSSSMKKKK